MTTPAKLSSVKDRATALWHGLRDDKTERRFESRFEARLWLEMAKVYQANGAKSRQTKRHYSEAEIARRKANAYELNKRLAAKREAAKGAQTRLEPKA